MSEILETPVAPTSRKPRIAIMGEFSAGKSTLSNLLIGSDPLPVKVTATQLPPVWIAHGTDDPYREDLEGNRHPVSLDNLDDVPLNETRVVRIFQQADILHMCDLIDMPGISDPNMSSDVWERVIEEADGVLWCTHATQAWRQSEAAVWKMLPDTLRPNSFLLLTRIDKLLTDRDRKKVVKRVGHETEGMFAGLFPISLTAALAAGDDRAAWERSGGEALASSIVDLLDRLSTELGYTDGMSRIEDSPEPSGSPHRNIFNPSVEEEQEIEPNPQAVTPVRIKPHSISGRTTPRPRRDEAGPSWTATGLDKPGQEQLDTAATQDLSRGEPS